MCIESAKCLQWGNNISMCCNDPPPPHPHPHKWLKTIKFHTRYKHGFKKMSVIGSKAQLQSLNLDQFSINLDVKKKWICKQVEVSRSVGERWFNLGRPYFTTTYRELLRSCPPPIESDIPQTITAQNLSIIYSVQIRLWTHYLRMYHWRKSGSCTKNSEF